MPYRVLLDTDLGCTTDPDDAIALAYLLLQPACELVGVTTVGLRSDWRADLADVICAEMGRADLPIIAGADRPLCATRFWDENPVTPWPEDASPCPRQRYEPNRAVEWMRQTIREAPGQITLITIGQFTNLATLMLVDPEAVGMLAGVVSMGGRFDAPKSECNVMLDPVAAKIVCERIGGAWTLTPLDAVRGMPLTGELLGRMLQGDRFGAVRTACGEWRAFTNKDHVGLADPATCLALFALELATFESARIDVDLDPHAVPSGGPFEPGELTGVTRRLETEDPPHRLMTKLNAEAAHQHILEVFGAA